MSNRLLALLCGITALVAGCCGARAPTPQPPSRSRAGEVARGGAPEQDTARGRAPAAGAHGRPLSEGAGEDRPPEGYSVHAEHARSHLGEPDAGARGEADVGGADGGGAGL